MPNANFDTLLSTTLNNHMPKLIDNVFSARPLVYFLKQAGQIRQISGGAKIVVPLLHGANSTANSYTGYGEIGITAQTGITAAEFNWKQYAATIAISGIEEAKNNSEEQIIDLLEAKVMQAEETIAENLDEMFCTSALTSNATDNENADWLGLPALIDDVTSTSGVGNISPISDTWWKSYKEATTAALTIGQMSTAYNTVSAGADQPNMVLTTQALYEKYESLLQPQLRFTDSKTADAGFQNLLFKGAPVLFDSYIGANKMYMLNTKYLRLVGHKDVWFKTTPFVRPNNIDARYAQILCYGELTISNRKRQGVLTNKS
jgi:hypothetical protein